MLLDYLHWYTYEMCSTGVDGGKSWYYSSSPLGARSQTANADRNLCAIDTDGHFDKLLSKNVLFSLR